MTALRCARPQKTIKQHFALPRSIRKEKEIAHARSHSWRILFQDPLFLFERGMMQHVADILHLNKLNKFKQLLTGTIFMKLSAEMMLVTEEFLHAAGFPVRCRKDDEQMCATWIGRDCTKFIDEAHLLLPHLLHLAYAPAEAGPKALAIVRCAEPSPAMPLARGCRFVRAAACARELARALRIYW